MGKGTLFAMASWGIKPKTSATTGAEIEAAEAAKREQNEKALKEMREEAARALQLGSPSSGSMSSGKRPVCMTSEAIRKRRERAHNKKKKQKAPREKAAVDAEKAAVEPEAETHYEDSRGRKRKRKMLRSIAGASGVTGKKGKRLYSDTEKEMLLEECAAQQKKTIGALDYGVVARELARKHPVLFGKGAPGMAEHGIGRQTVRHIVLRAAKKDQAQDGRGRPPALPQVLTLMILAALTSVVEARSTIVSGPMLQPVAIGVIIATGHATLLQEGRNGRGVFCCGLDYVRGLIRGAGWTCVRPQGDTRKVPDNWRCLRWLMVLRLAYFIFVHEIPRALVINADHTGIMFTQVVPPSLLSSHCPPTLFPVSPLSLSPSPAPLRSQPTTLVLRSRAARGSRRRPRRQRTRASRAMATNDSLPYLPRHLQPAKCFLIRCLRPLLQSLCGVEAPIQPTLLPQSPSFACRQVVLEGKTSGSLPNFSLKKKNTLYVKTREAPNSKQRKESEKPQSSACFKLNSLINTTSLCMISAIARVANIASFCVTPNHWSDDVTSRAYMEDVAVPYFKKEIEALRARDASLIKPFGEQVCVLIVDCWCER